MNGLEEWTEEEKSLPVIASRSTFLLEESRKSQSTITTRFDGSIESINVNNELKKGVVTNISLSDTTVNMSGVSPKSSSKRQVKMNQSPVKVALPVLKSPSASSKISPLKPSIQSSSLPSLEKSSKIIDYKIPSNDNESMLQSHGINLSPDKDELFLALDKPSSSFKKSLHVNIIASSSPNAIDQQSRSFFNVVSDSHTKPNSSLPTSPTSNIQSNFESNIQSNIQSPLSNIGGVVKSLSLSSAERQVSKSTSMYVKPFSESPKSNSDGSMSISHLLRVANSGSSKDSSRKIVVSPLDDSMTGS
jgi:hypothetical protein